MHRPFYILLKYSGLFIILTLFVGCAYNTPKGTDEMGVWKSDLKSEIQALGYRNWIVVADASFPFYNRKGIRTVAAPVETPEVVAEIISTIEVTQHVKPQFYLARELPAVKNNRAPGITEFRKELKTALGGHKPTELDEATLNRLLQGTSSSYAVLVIKTQTSLPYSAVFIELDSGYWDGEAERELRQQLNDKSSSKPSGGLGNSNKSLVKA